MDEELVEAIADMREGDAVRMAEEMLEKGGDPGHVLRLCQDAMAIVGERFERGEYFLPELIMSGAIMGRIATVIKPRLAGRAESKRIGKVVIGTVRGDIHDIGKDVVAFVLDVNGFEVHDLGVDVPEARFVEAVAEVQPQIVALSGFLTSTYEAMKATIEAITEAGLRDRVKIMIGGGQINEAVCKYAGADAYGKDAMAGVRLAKQWVGAS